MRASAPLSPALAFRLFASGRARCAADRHNGPDTFKRQNTHEDGAGGATASRNELVQGAFFLQVLRRAHPAQEALLLQSHHEHVSTRRENTLT